MLLLALRQRDVTGPAVWVVDGGRFNDFSLAMDHCTPLVPYSPFSAFSPHLDAQVTAARHPQRFPKWEVKGEPRKHTFGKSVGGS
mmetsp:Transcript_2216/g.4083  ORF Transcript_2216/g.4083 Transcript_2216/m.4083 type:complete len:85 (-) Transcript_2216:1028-1282(-)